MTKRFHVYEDKKVKFERSDRYGVHDGKIIFKPFLSLEEAEKYCNLLNELHEENQQLKSDLARTIEQAHKNNKLLVSDIRTLEKALWCPECTKNMKRLVELRKEYDKSLSPEYDNFWKEKLKNAKEQGIDFE